MAAIICQRLLAKVWRSYASDLEQVPETEGVYMIGNSAGIVMYMGRSRNMGRRLKHHKYGQQLIDQFVKQEFAANGGIHLRIKWVKERGHECVEGDYLQCIAERLGYWPKYNMLRGNTVSTPSRSSHARGDAELAAGRKALEAGGSTYSTPAYVELRGPKALAAYRRALEEGARTYDKQVNILQLGQDRVGKISVGKSLRGELFDKDDCSTDGVQMIPRVKNAGTEACR